MIRGTRAILDSYKDKITVYTHEGMINRGIAASLNLGIKNARSELIALMDHDDIWYKDKIATQVDIFDKFEDVGFVYVNGDVIDELERKLYKIYDKHHLEENNSCKLLLDCYVKSCSSVMVRKSILNNVGYFNDKLLPTDHDMWLRIQEITRFYYVKGCCFGYRTHPDQSINKRKLWEDGFVVLDEACRRNKCYTPFRRKRKAVLHYRLGEYDYKTKEYFSSGYNLLLSFFYDPVRALIEFGNFIRR